MKFKKLLCMISAAAMAICATCTSISFAEADTFTDLTQEEITAAMAAGWNLGNSLEANAAGVPSETAWGNPKVTEKLIQTVKDAGYSTIRIPVSYLGYIGDEASGYKVDEDWLARVKEVVDYAYDAGLYVIINMHGDGYYSVTGSWLLCAEDDEEQETIKEKYAAVWEQIAETFKDYDEHLIFESMNEEFDGKYSGQNWSAYDNINDYNQIFVDTVRQTGSNNAKRWLLVPGWNTDIDQTVNSQTYQGKTYGFEIPTDNYRDSSIPDDEQRIMISVHYYAPWDFCGDDTSTKYSQWGSDADPTKCASYSNTESYMEGQFKKVYNKFVSAGYPVVIGEYGCINKSSADPENTKYRAYYINTLCTYAKEYGCVPVYWDNGASSNSFGLINRSSCALVYPELIDAAVSVYSTDEENLARAIAYSSEKDEADYTADSWAVFAAALEAAKSATPDAASAYETLVEAYFGLTEAERDEDEVPVETAITEVIYNITATGGDATYSYQFSGTGNVPTYTFDVTEGTYDYTVYPETETSGFWNLGFGTLTSDVTLVVNSITINGYKFTSTDLKVGNVLSSDGWSNAILNIWQGYTGVVDSDDKGACLDISSSEMVFCVYQKESSDEPETYSVSGTISVSDEDTTTDMTVVAEAADGTETSVTATSMGEYVIEGLEAGTYTLTISGGKYAPRSYEVTVSAELAQDVELNPYGDVNGDGKVTTADVGLANSHAKGVTTLEDYEFVCADVNIDGEVTTADVGKINSHAKGVSLLW
ncbi:MAG: cellulase family glycosylhydrolase [Ruminococcus sp.]|nr:cellulase family glycosylhydrolase [Ruminococcus sp.]